MNFMVDTINHEQRCKIVSIEDPVEFVHENERSIVIQQEVGTDALSFRKALVELGSSWRLQTLADIDTLTKIFAAHGK